MVAKLQQPSLYKKKTSFRDCNNKAVIIRTRMFLEKKNVNFTKTETLIKPRKQMSLPGRQSIQMKTEPRTEMGDSQTLISENSPLENQNCFPLSQLPQALLCSRKRKHQFVLVHCLCKTEEIDLGKKVVFSCITSRHLGSFQATMLGRWESRLLRNIC